MIPHPGLGVDRLADRAEEAQGLVLVLLGPGLAGGHEGPDRRGGGVELGDLVLGDGVPVASGVGIGRNPLEHDGGGAVARKGTVDDVAVSRDPADVGGTVEDVLLVVVEDVLEGEVGVDHVAAGGVEHALGLARRTGRVEDVEGILGVHLLRARTRR